MTLTEPQNVTAIVGASGWTFRFGQVIFQGGASAHSAVHVAITEADGRYW